MLSTLVLLAALSAGGPALAPGTYSYSAAYNGSVVGASKVTVTRSGNGFAIAEDSSGQIGGQQGTGTSRLVLGADLSPLSYTESYQVPDDHATASVALTATSATSGGESFALSGDAKHFVVIEIGLVAGLFALPAQMQAWNNAAVQAIVPSFKASLSMTPDSSLTAARPDGVPAGDVALTFGGMTPLTIWYDPATSIPDQFVVPSQNIVVTRVRS
jgi:hypothetical protein